MMRSENAMDDVPRLPPVFVVSATSRDADHRLRSAMMACRQAGRGAVAFSSHWGAPEILVETGDSATSWPQDSQQTRLSASLELAARATQLLRTAGLIDCFKPVTSSPRPELPNARRQPPLIRVSIPAHFGVELMLLAGTVLRSLHDRQVMFMALCGTIDAALRGRFDSASLDDLKRYANQLPKQRMADLHPLFCLIGAWCGVARGVLDHVFTEETIAIRHTPAIPRRPPLSSVAERPQDARQR
jgi:hypothetical protein